MTPSSEPGADPLAALRHDLRTPVNHILGFSELLEEELADRGIRDGLEDLGKIRAAARKMLDIVNSSLGTESPKAPARRPAQHPPQGRVEPHSQPARTCGKILLVDDDDGNRETLRRRLEKEGHTVSEAADGEGALEALKAGGFDLVLLDMIMPGLDGEATLARMKAHEDWKHLPVVMISALDELATVTRCIEAGAEDYLPKPCDPALLRARIGACLEKKALRDQEQNFLRTIEETSNRLRADLEEAARYVVTTLPPETDAPLRIRWRFQPSSELGGDAFGHRALDSSRHALYLLDVCGHGVGAALLSVAATEALRSGTLPDADFTSPASVLSALNAAFPMERHGNMYFTIWYGVYDASTRTIRHGSGGHPPALLLVGSEPPRQLLASGMLVGAMPDTTYREDVCDVPPGARLVIFSDGAYELRRPGGGMIAFEDMISWVAANSRDEHLPEALIEWARSITGGGDFDDDVSVLTVDFPPSNP